MLATLVAAQESYEVKLADEVQAAPVKLVSGRFSGKRLPDVAALSVDGEAQIVFQPKTWSFAYDLRVINAEDMASVPGVGPNDEDRLLIVGGGFPRLSKFVPATGYELVNILVTGWHTVARVEATKHGSEYRIAGLKTGTGQLRFGVLDPTEDAEDLVTVAVQTVTDPVLDMRYADWDADGSAPELLVLTTNGLLVYDWSGNLRADGPAPFPAVEGHLADLQIGPRKAVWVHRPAAGANWLCHAGSTAGVVAATLPAKVGAKAVRALSGGGSTQPNAMLTVVEDAGVADAVVVEFDATGLGIVDWEADVLELGVPCGGFSDLDGDTKPDALWPKTGGKILRVAGAPPAGIGGGQHVLLLHEFSDLDNLLVLTFLSGIDGTAVVRAFHQSSPSAAVNPVGTTTSGDLASPLTVALPSPPSTAGIFHLEIELELSTGELVVLLFPYLYRTTNSDPNYVAVQQSIVEPSSAIDLPFDPGTPDRRISIIPRPLRYMPGPRSTPPPTAD